MCRRITCAKCGKASYAGCGMHIEQVLSDVPESERCACGKSASVRAPAPEPQKRSSRWWQR